MYIPTAFEIQDPERLARFIAENSFATVVSHAPGSPPFASHIPLLFDPAPKPAGLLLGHLARANPQWRQFETHPEVLVVFHGPHAYISPRWYASSPAVPTWNYAVVHALGVSKIFTQEDRLEALVRRMVKFYEGEGENAWPGDLPSDFMARQLGAIVGIEIQISRLEGKFKLGQNRQKADVDGVYAALTQSARPEELLLAEFMKREGLAEGK